MDRKIVVLGDTHGLDTWKKIVSDNPDATKFIFIGDYVDSFHIPGYQQLENFRDILEFKRQNKDLVELLIGNHDFHYMPWADEQYSGYQKEYQFLLKVAMIDAIGVLKAAYKVDNLLFTHAGVTKTWWNNWFDHPWGDNIDEEINDLFHHKPRAFRFQGTDYYGESITQGPFWVRSGSLAKDCIPELIHVIGHTPVKWIETHVNPIMIDCIEHGKKQYLVITHKITAHNVYEQSDSAPSQIVQQD